MNITVDTSAILAVLTHEPHRETLVRLTEGADLIAPQSVHWEIGNALSAMFKRKRITLDQAIACLHSYRIIPLRFVDIPLENVLRVAHRNSIYAYDACLVVCAQQLGGTLLTLDAGLRQVAAKEGVTVLEVRP